MTLFSLNILAQAAPAPSIFETFILPMLIVFFIVFFMAILPQRREQKRKEEMLKTLKKGDVVLTSAGIIGKVSRQKNDQIELKVDDTNGTKIIFLRSSIVMKLEQDEKEEAGEEKKN